MFGSAIIEVAIGLVVIYILFSLVGSTITEGIAQILNLRGKNLVKGIERILSSGHESDLVNKFFNHPLVKGLDHTILKKNRRARPDYVSYSTFTTVVGDILDFRKKTKEAGGDIDEVLESLPEGDLKVSLLALFSSAKGRVDAFEDKIATWYDESMDRVSAVYKRKAHLITFITAFGLVIFFNIDTLHFGNLLYQNSNMRQALVAVGEQMNDGDFGEMGEAPADTADEEAPADGADGEAPKDPEDEDDTDVGELFNAVKDTKLPLGWSADQWEQTQKNPLGKLLGLLISLFAISLGAPFWFQVLNRLVNLKSSGIKPPTMEEHKRLLDNSA